MISGNTSLVTWIDVDAADTTERRFYSVRYRLSGRRGQYLGVPFIDSDLLYRGALYDRFDCNLLAYKDSLTSTSSVIGCDTP
jgi:hypothetical protein